jgi:ubiquinol-cytochrome c reductase cytochrome c1 subunit
MAARAKRMPGAPKEPDMLKRMIVAATLACLAAVGGVAGTARDAEATPVPNQNWSFEGVFGTFDRAAMQRGFQVYKEVCAACHSLKYVTFRDLEAIGYNEEQAKGIAAAWPQQVTDGPDDAGQMFQRPARPSDRIPGPFPNDQAARAANNGALPPDLSLLAKARVSGPDYLYAVLTGYGPAPAHLKMMPGMYYNAFYPGHQIAMPPPLNPDQLTYSDNTPATVAQMAHDVSAFLMWAAEPNLEERHRTGFKVMLFLLVTTGVFYAVKRKIWSRMHH